MLQLDGIRGLAVLSVLAWHWIPPYPYFRYFPLGVVGVRVFFVLSGFLITRILLRARNAAEQVEAPWWAPVRTFYIRRVLRIFPVYYVILAFILIGGVPAARQNFQWHLLYLSNFLSARQGTAGGSTGHFWSLAVEEQFYMVWPWLVLFLPRKIVPWLIVSVFAMGPIYRLLMSVFSNNYPATAMLPMGCFDSLGAGAMLAWGMEQGSAKFLKRLTTFNLTAGLPILALGLFFYCTRPDSNGQDLDIGSIVLIDLGVALTSAWVIYRASSGFGGVVGRFLSCAPLIYMGTVSYCVYIVHPFVHNIVLKLLAKMHIGEASWETQPSKDLRVILAIATTSFTITMIISTASWFLFERRLVKLGHTLTTQPVRA